MVNKFVGFVLAAIMLLHFIGANLYSHNHFFNGFKIVHSHFYSMDSDPSAANHTETEFITIEMLCSLSYVVISFVFASILLEKKYCKYINRAKDSLIIKNYSVVNPRGPPVLN